jgi:hypothetical protein
MPSRERGRRWWRGRSQGTFLEDSLFDGSSGWRGAVVNTSGTGQVGQVYAVCLTVEPDNAVSVARRGEAAPAAVKNKQLSRRGQGSTTHPGSLPAALLRQRPSRSSPRQRAVTWTHSISVCPTAVHSRDRFPTSGFSLGSKAYIDHWSHCSW